MLHNPHHPIKPIGGPEKKPDINQSAAHIQADKSDDFLGKLEILTGEPLKRGGALRKVPPHTKKGLFATLRNHLSRLLQRHTEYHQENPCKNCLSIHTSSRIFTLTGKVVTKVKQRNPHETSEMIQDLMHALSEIPRLFKEKAGIETLSHELQWAIQFSPLLTTAIDLSLPLEKILIILKKSAQKAGLQCSENILLQHLLIGHAILRHHCGSQITTITRKLHTVVSSIQIRHTQLESNAQRQQNSLRKTLRRLSEFLGSLNPLRSKTSRQIGNIKIIADTLSATSSYDELKSIIHTKKASQKTPKGYPKEPSFSLADPSKKICLFGEIPDPLKYFLNGNYPQGPTEGGDDLAIPYTEKYSLKTEAYRLRTQKNPQILPSVAIPQDDPYPFIRPDIESDSQKLIRSTTTPINALDTLNAALQRNINMSVETQQSFQETITRIADQLTTWIDDLEELTKLIQQFITQIQTMIDLSLTILSEFKLAHPEETPENQTEIAQFENYIESLEELQATLSIVQNFSSNPECLPMIFKNPEHCQIVYAHTKLEEGMNTLVSLGQAIASTLANIQHIHQNNLNPDITNTLTQISEQIPDYEQQKQWKILLETIEELTSFTQETTQIVEQIPSFMARYSHLTKDMQECITEVISSSFINKMKTSQQAVIELSTL
jgi:hypothetical protein